MIKEQFLEKYQNKAVWCKTEELANEFLELADGFGFRWWFGNENAKSRNEYNFYRQGTVYYLDSYFEIQTTSRSIAEKQMGKSRVIEFQSLKKTTYQKVLDILGLKVGDEFKTGNKGFENIYVIKENGIFKKNEQIVCDDVLGELVRGAFDFKIITKPKITEAERVILENLDKSFNYIGRNETGKLMLKEIKYQTDFNFNIYFNHLFTFIKPNEEYEIKELLGSKL